jgi:very-short-patch-repair endonuclease
MRPANVDRTQRARNLRRDGSLAEQLLWGGLRGRRLSGFKFVRQAPIGPYFADFLCLCRSEKLIIEVDGATHSTEEERARDLRREADLGDLGYRILRVQNIDVFENLEGVLETIMAALEDRPSA